MMVEAITTADENLFFRLENASKNWSSEEHVQLWIDNLTESDFVARASEASSPTKTSFDSDVFLHIPCSDDLVLGAEAKHYGGFTIVSPRLSPLMTEQLTDDGQCNRFTECFVEGQLCDLGKSSSTSRLSLEKLLQERSVEESENNDDFMLKRMEYAEGSSTSWASSFDNPTSLAAAALFTDPEELLFDLGFCDQASLLDVIPSRFFAQPSAAFGIHVDEIHNALKMENESPCYSIGDSLSNPLVQRFSESSVEVFSHTSSDSTKNRRILFRSSRNDIPSIHLSQEENDRPLSSVSETTSGSNNWNRLATLEEVPEPISRSSSFESDLLTQQTIASFLAATQQKLQNGVGFTPVDKSRKYSDGSRNDTLTDSVNEADPSKDHFERNKSIESSLHAPVSLTRSNSDKSTASVVTVINASNQDSNVVTDENGNDSSLVNISVFTSINEDDSQEEKLKNDDVKEGSVSSVSRRAVFRSTKSSKLDLSDDSVFVSKDSSDEACKKNQTTLNDTFREFFKKLKGEHNMTKLVDEKPCIQIIVTPPDNTVNELVFHKEDIQETACEQQDKKSPKKSYFSSAITSISNVLGKYQDSLKSSCHEKVQEGGSSSENFKNKNKTESKYFNFFKYQTFSTHSNSAFTPYVAGLNDGETDLDKDDEDWTNQIHAIGGSKEKIDERHFMEIQNVDRVLRNTEDLPVTISDSSVERSVEFQGYDADSTSSYEQDSHDVSVKRKRSAGKKITKRVSVESSGFDDEPIVRKCPLGKKCTINHAMSRQRNVTSEASRSCEVCRKIRSRTTSHQTSGNSLMLMTHEHFDFLIQQFTSLRSEMKEEFQKQERKEILFNEKINQTKEKIEKEYLSWIVKEMMELKSKLKDKDDEIRRLRDMINNDSHR